MPETSIDDLLRRELARDRRARVWSWVLLAVSIILFAIARSG